jgi:hypothetical protein
MQLGKAASLPAACSGVLLAADAANHFSLLSHMSNVAMNEWEERGGERGNVSENAWAYP